MKSQAIAVDRHPWAQMRLLWLAFLTGMLVLAQALVAHARPESFADLAEASHELWRRRGTKYPRLRPAGDEEVARFAEKQPSGPSTDLSL